MSNQNDTKVSELFEQWGKSSKSTDGDYFRSLESGLPSSERNKRWIVALQSYIDASGMSGKEPYLVLAGFVSIAQVWAKFSDAWQAELDTPPSISYFKLNEAFHPKHYSQFKGWDKKDIIHKINKLANVIKSTYPLGRVVSYIAKREVEQLIIKQLPKRRMDNPYSLCFLHLIVNIVARQCKSQYKVPIDFIFDDEGEIGYDCAKWLNYFKKTVIPKYSLPYFGSITFADDRRVVALQAADLYAGLFRRNLFENKSIFMPMSKELKILQEIPKIHEKQLSLKEISLYIQKEEIRAVLKHKIKGGLTHII